MTPDKIEINKIARQEAAAIQSLIEFRRFFMPDKADVEPAEFHHRWSGILLNGRGHHAFEAFRESAKTQIVIRANLLHALSYPSEDRCYIVVICATQTIASKRLRDVTREWAQSPDMCAMEHKVIEDSGNAFEVHYATGQCKKVRIEAYGKGTSVRGLSWGARRPDLVVCDDLQDTEDARSETVTENDWDWFLSDVYFLGESSRIFLIGNNLGERCIIERVLRSAERLKFTGERIPILNENGQSNWPSRYQKANIEAERESFAAEDKLDSWFRERMCQVISPSSQKFKREYFQYYDGKVLNTANMSIYTTVDLAISQKRDADYSVVLTIGVNGDGHWFVLDVDTGRYDPSQTIDAIFSAVEKWRPLSVGIESVAYQSALQHFITKEMPKRNQFFSIRPLTASKAKELRIDTLQPRFAAQSVWFRRAAWWVEKLERELLAYPHGAHDDIIDALAYMEQIAHKPLKGNMDSKKIPIAGRL